MNIWKKGEKIVKEKQFNLCEEIKKELVDPEGYDRIAKMQAGDIEKLQLDAIIGGIKVNITQEVVDNLERKGGVIKHYTSLNLGDLNLSETLEEKVLERLKQEGFRIGHNEETKECIIYWI